MTSVFNGRGRGVTAITVTYNSEHVIAGWLQAMRAIAPEAETIVVDNASDDDSVSAARSAKADVIVPLQANQGFGRACNAGVAASNSPFVLFANPDVALKVFDCAPNMLRHSGIGACYLESGNARARPSLGAETSYGEDLVLNALGPLFPRFLSERVLMRERPHRWVSGALFLMQRADFLRLGGFDARLFLYYEDRDLSRRARARGLSIYEVPGICGVHTGGSSTTEPNPMLIGWRVVGWIEYIGIWNGRTAARRAARQTVTTISNALRVLPPRAPGGLVARKILELEAVLAHLHRLESRLPVSDAGLLPHARDALPLAFRGSQLGRHA